MSLILSQWPPPTALDFPSSADNQVLFRQKKLGAYLMIYDDNSKIIFFQIFIKTYVVGAH